MATDNEVLLELKAFREEFQSFKKEVRGDIEEVRGDIEEVRGDIQSLETKLRRQIRENSESIFDLELKLRRQESVQSMRSRVPRGGFESGKISVAPLVPDNISISRWDLRSLSDPTFNIDW